jgi:peptidoglycan-associated lipoprotein
MLKRVSFYAVFVFLIAAFMTAGCAQQDVVKKDEGIAPVPVAKQVDHTNSNGPISSVTPTKQAAAVPATQPISSPASAQQQQKTSSIEELQAALKTIYFDFDSARLSESARSILTKNAAVLARETMVKIRVEGNCDERGSAEYNLALGERRAKEAQQYLNTLGINPARVSIVSYGKEKPTVQGNDEAAWSKNRRDEFVVTTK